jgi:hypothetical protein
MQKIFITHGMLWMGMRYFIATTDDSMPWSSHSPHAPISVRLSFCCLEPISRHKRCLRRSPFWWPPRKPFCEIRGWHQSLDAFQFPRSTSEIRTSPISAICGQNADHFSPSPCNSYNFLEVFSALNLLLGELLRIRRIITLLLLNPFDGEDWESMLIVLAL